MLYPGSGVARRRSVLGLSAERIENLELGVDDVCVTRDQFADVFGGSQVGAAGVPTTGAAGTPRGSSAPSQESADTISTTTPSSTTTPPSEDIANEPEAAGSQSDVAEAPDAATGGSSAQGESSSARIPRAPSMRNPCTRSPRAGRQLTTRACHYPCATRAPLSPLVVPRPPRPLRGPFFLENSRQRNQHRSIQLGGARAAIERFYPHPPHQRLHMPTAHLASIGSH